uniref:zonular occludens toxin family protein n=1 Tax=Neisseria weaveri TaxID=28091 RepID=UPI000D2FFFE9
MLYLITGVPGSGKTLKMISDLMNRKDLQNRPLYLDGIPEVNSDIIPNQPIPEGESMQTWHKWAPTGAILVIDECQRVFRPMPSGSKIPDYIAELETHRHRGIDIFLLTQHPRLIHANVRSLIGHHCHIGKTSLGARRMVEWERCANPEANSDIANGVKSVYTLDKKAFGVYKSAEEHTKIKTSRSKIIYIFPLALLAIILGCFYVYESYKDIAKPIEQPKVSASAESPDTVGAVAASAANDTNVSGQYPPIETKSAKPERPKPHLSEDDYKPRIDGQPHTAPIYDSLNKQIKTMPYPVACVKNANKCTCYTDQATPIKGLAKSQCLDFVENGIYNPYKQTEANTLQ